MNRSQFIELAAVAFLALVIANANISAQIATGGTYVLQQASIANGGGNSSAGNYAVEGTTGQAAAGANPAGGIYALKSGFWNPLISGPSAANVSVAGRVFTADGSGIRNVVVSISGGPLTTPRSALSTSFGYFNFDDVEVGHTYVISVVSKRYNFAQSSQVISVVDNITDLTFTASWPN